MSKKCDFSAGKTNSVTEDIIGDRIQSVQFETLKVFGKTFTFCFILMDNEFVQVGDPSVCVDDKNFDEDQCRLISFDNSKEGLWKLEGYRMMSKKHD